MTSKISTSMVTIYFSYDIGSMMMVWNSLFALFFHVDCKVVAFGDFNEVKDASERICQSIMSLLLILTSLFWIQLW